jgi:hypothetical protein
MEGYERKNKEEIHKELQDIDPIGSPHLEEKVIGGNEDLDLLSLFPPNNDLSSTKPNPLFRDQLTCDYV